MTVIVNKCIAIICQDLDWLIMEEAADGEESAELWLSAKKNIMTSNIMTLLWLSLTVNVEHNDVYNGFVWFLIQKSWFMICLFGILWTTILVYSGVWFCVKNDDLPRFCLDLIWTNDSIKVLFGFCFKKSWFYQGCVWMFVSKHEGVTNVLFGLFVKHDCFTIVLFGFRFTSND